MLRASWKNLLARRVRLLMSASAIVLGVAFVAGSLVFTDTLARVFDGVTSGSVGDVVVRPAGSTGASGVPSKLTVPGSEVPRLRTQVPGAARVDGVLKNYGTFVLSTKGKVVGAAGTPGIAVNYTGGRAAHGLPAATLKSGHWPTTDNEVVLDATTAKTGGYRSGDTVRMVSSDRPRFSARMVGTAEYGNGSLAGASLVILRTSYAQQLFVGGRNQFQEIWLTAPDGTSQQELRDQVAAHLPKSLEAVTGDRAAKESGDAIQKALGFITTFLLVFAVVALIVGSFIIVNTFSILVTQRARELALLRAIGARRGQVTGSVLFEALIMGVLGSTVGLGLGIALAWAIRWVFSSRGIALGDGLVFRERTVITAYVVGVLMTLLAAYLPARRAGNVPPVAAMREETSPTATSSLRMITLGLSLLLAGGLAVWWGIANPFGQSIRWMGAGIAALVLGSALAAPVLGWPIIRVFGAVTSIGRGAVGPMAERNAVRNPTRTAATASALMIGITLVTMISILGSSASTSIDRQINRDFAGDFVIANAVGVPFSTQVAAQARTVPNVQEVAQFRQGIFLVNYEPTFVTAFDPVRLARIKPPEMLDGTFRGLGTRDILVSDTQSESANLYVGDTLDLRANSGGAAYRVVGIFRSSAMFSANYLISLASAQALHVDLNDSFDYIKVAPGVPPATVLPGLQKLVANQPLVSVKDQAQFAADRRAPIDQLLNLIYALLGLAVVIAVLGIVNTLALSIVERTREIGLLRAVGLSRRQLRRLIRLESVVIALVGAGLGVLLGLVAGVVLQKALANQGIDTLAVPRVRLIVFVVLAMLVGVLAAWWPGRRAAALDVLRAIGTE